MEFDNSLKELFYVKQKI